MYKGWHGRKMMVLAGEKVKQLIKADIIGRVRASIDDGDVGIKR